MFKVFYEYLDKVFDNDFDLGVKYSFLSDTRPKEGSIIHVSYKFEQVVKIKILEVWKLTSFEDQYYLDNSVKASSRFSDIANDIEYGEKINISSRFSSDATRKSED